jgi:hypothetical protein
MPTTFITNLQTRIHESMSSIRAIKGDKFADATNCLFRGTHTSANLNVLLSQSGVDESLRANLMDQLTSTLSSHMNLIVNLNGFQDEDVEEMMKWVDVMHKHVHTAIEESS